MSTDASADKYEEVAANLRRIAGEFQAAEPRGVLWRVLCLEQAAEELLCLRLALADAERKRQEWRQLAEALADNAAFLNGRGRWQCCCCACTGDTPGSIDHSPACAVYLVGCAAAPGEAAP
jgi:hypothetical protein